MGDHDDPEQPCEHEKMAVRKRDEMNWAHRWRLPGPPYTEFLLDKRFCGLRKKAQRITTKIGAGVSTCGERALQRAFDRSRKGMKQEEDEPFTRNAPTSSLVGTRNLWRREESRRECISDQSSEIKPHTRPCPPSSVYPGFYYLLFQLLIVPLQIHPYWIEWNTVCCISVYLHYIRVSTASERCA
jgi:hypothetical protein